MPRGRPPAREHIEDGRPKGKMSAYAFFVQACRELHKQSHPDENVIFSEFSKKCADRWKTMSDKEKLRFNQLAEKDKTRYEVEMASYVPKKAQAQSKSEGGSTAASGAGAAAGGKKGPLKKKKKKMKDPNAPKRCM